MTSAPDHQPEQLCRPIDHLAECGIADAPALVLRDGTLTYKDLRERVGRLAAWLSMRVAMPGARIATWAAKGELSCLMPLATARAGLVHVPINPLLKPMQVAHILKDCGASMLLGTSARVESLARGDVPADCVVMSEQDALAQASGSADLLGPSDVSTDDLAAILYTSGSTGQPKGVMLSHANMWLGAVSVAQYLKMQADDRTLAVLPLSFDYGQNQLFSTWIAGGCVIPMDYLLPRDVVKACSKHRITTLAAVPPLWIELAELDWPADTAGEMRRVTNSGGALTEDLVRRLRSKLPNTDIFPMYGLTEAFRSTFLDPHLVDSHPTSMGKAIPHAEVLVVNDAGEEAAVDEEGELVHCGPLVAQGYWQDEARTAERFRPAPQGSRYGGMAVWSGDRVRRDAEGLLHYVGRRDAMIKSAGNRISPQEVEDAARATGLVADVAAVGIDDARLGQAVHLVARPAGRRDTAERELPTLLSKILPGFMQPRAIHWRDHFPLNPNGKLDRPALIRGILQELAE